MIKTIKTVKISLFFSIFIIYNNDIFDLLKTDNYKISDFFMLKRKIVEDKEDLGVVLQQALNNRKIISILNIF